MDQVNVTLLCFSIIGLVLSTGIGFWFYVYRRPPPLEDTTELTLADTAFDFLTPLTMMVTVGGMIHSIFHMLLFSLLLAFIILCSVYVWISGKRGIPTQTP